MDEDIYMNLEELHGAACDWSSEHSPASHSTKGTASQNKTKTFDSQWYERERREKLRVNQGLEVNKAVGRPVSISVEPEQQSKHGRRQKWCVLFVSLLCFLLLATVTALSVRYHRDVHQLSRNLTNQSAEKSLLLLRYHSLRQEADQLNATYRRMMKKAVKCPSGWTQFGCSCYLLESSRDSWDQSRRLCQRKGGDLVTITSEKEMAFLNKLGSNLRFWIGLRMETMYSWTWTNGKSLEISYWRSGRSSFYSSSSQTCAAFNSFQPVSSLWSVQSWTKESCTNALQGLCEKEASS